jgi:hypothetical protein
MSQKGLLHFNSFYFEVGKARTFFGNFRHCYSFVSGMKFTTTHVLITTS